MTPFETDSIHPGKDITEMINKFNIDFNSVIKYTLILGSFQDTYNENKKLNSFLISSMSELRKMFDVIITAKKQKYVHRNMLHLPSSGKDLRPHNQAQLRLWKDQF